MIMKNPNEPNRRFWWKAKNYDPVTGIEFPCFTVYRFDITARPMHVFSYYTFD